MAFGDGADFHLDYYNNYGIHPYVANPESDSKTEAVLRSFLNENGYDDLTRLCQKFKARIISSH